MDRQAIITELRSIIGDYIKDRELVLVDFIDRYEGRDLCLRILVDRPEGGISLDECSRLNNQLSQILDAKVILKERYILEISSPGVDRSLKTKSDFLRCLNRKVRIFFSESLNAKTEIEGLMVKVDDEAVYIDIRGEVFKAPLVKIKQAKQIID